MNTDEDGVELNAPNNYVQIEVLAITVKLCENTTYKYLLKSKMECYSLCPEKYFPDESINICLDCMDYCLTCVNISVCEECEDGYEFIEM